VRLAENYIKKYNMLAVKYKPWRAEPICVYESNGLHLLVDCLAVN